MEKMGEDRGMNFYPFLWTKYDDLEKLSRKNVPIEEIWNLHINTRIQLLEKK